MHYVVVPYNLNSMNNYSHFLISLSPSIPVARLLDSRTRPHILAILVEQAWRWRRGAKLFLSALSSLGLLRTILPSWLMWVPWLVCCWCPCASWRSQIFSCLFRGAFQTIIVYWLTGLMARRIQAYFNALLITVYIRS